MTTTATAWRWICTRNSSHPSSWRWINWRSLRLVGKDPIEAIVAEGYFVGMNPILLILILLLLFGGGGFYLGGPAIGGGGIGLILVICLIIYLVGGFRTKN